MIKKLVRRHISYKKYVAFRKGRYFVRRCNPFWNMYERYRDEVIEKMWYGASQEDRDAASASMVATVSARGRSVANLFVTVGLMATVKVGLIAVFLPVGISIKSPEMVRVCKPLLVALFCDAWSIRALWKELNPKYRDDERFTKLKHGTFGNYNEQGHRSMNMRYSLWRSRVWVSLGLLAMMFALLKAYNAIEGHAAGM